MPVGVLELHSTIGKALDQEDGVLDLVRSAVLEEGIAAPLEMPIINEEEPTRVELRVGILEDVQR